MNIPIEDFVRAVQLIKDQDLRLDVTANMKKHGGSFVKILADLIVAADGENLLRIVETWPEYIVKYDPLKWKNEKK